MHLSLSARTAEVLDKIVEELGDYEGCLAESFNFEGCSHQTGPNSLGLGSCPSFKQLSLKLSDPLITLNPDSIAPGLGMSILEMGHRDAGGPVQQVLQEAGGKNKWHGMGHKPQYYCNLLQL
jgi:hypothetical protein